MPYLAPFFAALTLTKVLVYVALIAAAYLLTRKKPPSFDLGSTRPETEVIQAVSEKIFILGTAKVAGALIYLEQEYIDSTDSDKRGDTDILYQVHAIAGHSVESVEMVIVRGEQATVGLTVTEHFKSGGDAAEKAADDAAASGEFHRRPKAFADALAFVPKFGATDPVPSSALQAPGWTANHRLDGSAWVMSILQQNSYDVTDPDSRFWSSRPEIQYVVRGAHVFDPRTGTTGHSDNWALCVGWWLIHRMGFSVDDIDLDTWKASADKSDEITVSGDRRFTINGAFKSGQDDESLLAEFQKAGGRIVPLADKIMILADSPKATTLDISEKMVVGSPTINPTLPLADVYNRVTARYFDKTDFYIEREIEPVENERAISDDGETLAHDVGPMTFINDARTARRRIRTLLRQASLPFHAQVDISTDVEPGAVELLPWDTITFTWSDLGIERRKMRITGLGKGDGVVTLTLVEENDLVYDDTIEPAAIPAQILALPTISSVPIVTDAAATSGDVIAVDGTLVVEGKITWRPADVQKTRVRWHVPGGDWVGDTTADSSYVIRGLTPDQEIEISLQHVNNVGIAGTVFSLSFTPTVSFPLPAPVATSVLQVGSAVRILLDEVPARPDLSALEIRYTHTDLESTDSLPVITAGGWDESERLDTQPITPSRPGLGLLATVTIPASGRYRLFGRLLDRSLRQSPVADFGEYSFQLPTTGETFTWQAWPDYPGSLSGYAFWPHGEIGLLPDPQAADLTTRDSFEGKTGWPFMPADFAAFLDGASFSRTAILSFSDKWWGFWVYQGLGGTLIEAPSAFSHGKADIRWIGTRYVSGGGQQGETPEPPPEYLADDTILLYADIDRTVDPGATQLTFRDGVVFTITSGGETRYVHVGGRSWNIDAPPAIYAWLNLSTCRGGPEAGAALRHWAEQGQLVTFGFEEDKEVVVDSWTPTRRQHSTFPGFLGSPVDMTKTLIVGAADYFLCTSGSYLALIKTDTKSATDVLTFRPGITLRARAGDTSVVASFDGQTFRKRVLQYSTLLIRYTDLGGGAHFRDQIKTWWDDGVTVPAIELVADTGEVLASPVAIYQTEVIDAGESALWAAALALDGDVPPQVFPATDHTLTLTYADTVAGLLPGRDGAVESTTTTAVLKHNSLSAQLRVEPPSSVRFFLARVQSEVPKTSTDQIRSPYVEIAVDSHGRWSLDTGLVPGALSPFVDGWVSKTDGTDEISLKIFETQSAYLQWGGGSHILTFSPGVYLTLEANPASAQVQTLARQSVSIPVGTFSLYHSFYWEQGELLLSQAWQRNPPVQVRLEIGQVTQAGVGIKRLSLSLRKRTG